MAALAFLFSFHGTAGRGAAFSVWLAALIAFVIMGVLAQLAPMQQRLFFPISALSTVALLTVSARRLHHAGQSGRWAVLTLVPVLGLAAGLVIALLPERRTRLWANNTARFAGYVGIFALLALGLWRVFWTPYLIPSESMKPTLLVGDYAVMRARPGDDVARGDVVVLRRGTDGATLVKRVIALGGDTVALRGGVVWLNGAALAQMPMGEFAEIMQPQGPDAVRPRCENGLVGDGALCRKSIWREVLPNGRSYQIANIETGGTGDDYREVVVPAGHMFVLGDNRDNSIDSRYDPQVGGLGFVPQTEIFGVVRRVLVSAAGPAVPMVWTWRAGRILARVN